MIRRTRISLDLTLAETYVRVGFIRSARVTTCAETRAACVDVASGRRAREPGGGQIQADPDVIQVGRGACMGALAADGVARWARDMAAARSASGTMVVDNTIIECASTR